MSVLITIKWFRKSNHSRGQLRHSPYSLAFLNCIEKSLMLLISSILISYTSACIYTTKKVQTSNLNLRRFRLHFLLSLNSRLLLFFFIYQFVSCFSLPLCFFLIVFIDMRYAPIWSFGFCFFKDLKFMLMSSFCDLGASRFCWICCGLEDDDWS